MSVCNIKLVSFCQLFLSITNYAVKVLQRLIFNMKLNIECPIIGLRSRGEEKRIRVFCPAGSFKIGGGAPALRQSVLNIAHCVCVCPPFQHLTPQNYICLYSTEWTRLTRIYWTHTPLTKTIREMVSGSLMTDQCRSRMQYMR